jgi:hypothetical protein
MEVPQPATKAAPMSAADKQETKRMMTHPS